jgi:hypothetical protein
MSGLAAHSLESRKHHLVLQRHSVMDRWVVVMEAATV